MEFQLSWEKAFNGDNALLTSSNYRKIFSTALSLKLAITKMKDFRIISDSFDGNPALFCPFSWVLIESSGKSDFLGSYISDNEGDSETEKNLYLKVRLTQFLKFSEGY